MAPVVLFVNHRDQACGVQQMGQKVFNVLQHSQNYACSYIDPAEEREFDYWADLLQPRIVIYNWYTSGVTLPWLTPEKINRQRHRFKQCSIFHEGAYDHMGFDLIFHQDPSYNGEQAFATPIARLTRPIPDYATKSTKSRSLVNKPIIKSFGFGLGGKGFTRLAEAVCDEFEQAELHYNIPFARFGDENGAGAQSWRQSIEAIVSQSPGISCTISHVLMPERELLDWLTEADLLAFFYDDNRGRGISGTTDYCISVSRPIAITRSDQFKHIWQVDDSFVYPDKSLKEILAMGTDPTDKFREMWAPDALMNSFESGFRMLGVH